LKKFIKYAVLLLSLSLICTGHICQAINIQVTGNYSETINASQLQAGPGSDLTDTYESAVDAAYIDVSATTGSWSIDIKKVDTNWHANFHLYVKRTSDGNGSGSISGGLSYQEITDTDQNFFGGNRARSFVDLQLRLTGVSVQIPPDTYTTTVYYTVIEN
jgi:hypothetical protein